MKNRNLLLTGMAAGAVVGGLSWLLVRRATEIGPVEPLRLGEPFPTVSGTTLAGESVTLPDDLGGRVGLLILGFDYAARYEVSDWARHIADTFGETPNLALYQMPMISSIGPLMRRAIDSAMVRGTPEAEQSRVLTVYGDLRWLRKRLGVSGPPEAYVFLLGRTGRVVWRTEGGLTEESRAALDAAMEVQGINRQSTPG